MMHSQTSCLLNDTSDDDDLGSAMYNERNLRELCCRIFGWSNKQMVDDVMQTLITAVARRGAVALRGESDLVPVAYSLHRRLFGSERPFVVCDPRRRDGDGSVRAPPNRNAGMLAVEAAVGGSVCIRSNRLPVDFGLLVSSLREQGSVSMLFICLKQQDCVTDILCRPLEIPSLAQRSSELDRLFDEYLEDAAQMLMVGSVQVSDAMRKSVLCDVKTLIDLEKAAMRVVALQSSHNISQAARRLNMAPVSLTRWLGRRRWVGSTAGTTPSAPYPRLIGYEILQRIGHADVPGHSLNPRTERAVLSSREGRYLVPPGIDIFELGLITKAGSYELLPIDVDDKPLWNEVSRLIVTQKQATQQRELLLRAYRVLHDLLLEPNELEASITESSQRNETHPVFGVLRQAIIEVWKSMRRGNEPLSESDLDRLHVSVAQHVAAVWGLGVKAVSPITGGAMGESP
jgi:hypothetical protein